MVSTRSFSLQLLFRETSITTLREVNGNINGEEATKRHKILKVNRNFLERNGCATNKEYQK